jgi:hypothetical protein
MVVMVLPVDSQQLRPISVMSTQLDVPTLQHIRGKWLGIKHTELTSGTPPGPGRRGSAVMEALQRRGRGGEATSENGGLGGVRVDATTIATRTTTASF